MNPVKVILILTWLDFKLVDQSIQKYDSIEYNDISIQKDINQSRVDYSIQGSIPHHDVSIQPSFGYQDVSISMSRRDRSFGASVKNQSNQLSVISQ